MKLMRTSPLFLRKRFVSILLLVFLTFMALAAFAPLAHATTVCGNGQPDCMEKLMDCAHFTATTLTAVENAGATGTCSSGAVGNAQYNSGIFGNAFVYVAVVACNPNSVYVSAVSSTVAGAFTPLSTGGSQILTIPVVDSNNGGSFGMFAAQVTTGFATSDTFTITLSGGSPTDCAFAMYVLTGLTNGLAGFIGTTVGTGAAQWSVAANNPTLTVTPTISLTTASTTMLITGFNTYMITNTGSNNILTYNSPFGPTNQNMWNTNPTSIGAAAGTQICNPGVTGCGVASQTQAVMFFTTTGATGYSVTINPTQTTTAEAGQWVIIAWGISGTTTATSQTQTVGSCPPGGGTGIGHYALTNSTIFFYPGNALGAEVVNSVSTEVSSIKGSGSHTLQLLVYSSSGQTPSVSSPAFRVFAQSYTITSGTTNSTITTQVSIPLNNPVINALPFNYFFVGIVGDDHIFIAGSSLSGLMTQTGNVPANPQPTQFTSVGAGSTNKLALCASASYQSVLSFTSTTTASGTGTTTSTAFTTQTISTIGANLLTTSTNWPVIFLILMLPAGLLLGATRTIVGALLGLMIGAVIGVMGGILPAWIFIGLVIALVAVAFLSRSRE